METNNQNELVHSSQVIDEQGALSFNALPLDLGMSQLPNIEKDTIVLADGRLVKLTGGDNDLHALASDMNMRVKQTLIHRYLWGLNLAIAKTYFTEAYGSSKEFYTKMTELTGFSRSMLESQVRISQGFTKDEIERLTEAGVSQSIAHRLLKASPEKREEALDIAEEGYTLNNAVVSELLDVESDDEEEVLAHTSEKSLFNGSSAATDKTTPENQPVSEMVVDVVGSFQNYTDTVKDTKDYSPQTVSVEQRFNQIVAAVESNRIQHKLSTVRGQSVRCAMANVLAGVYAIEIPTVIEAKNEPEWFKALRGKLAINKQTGKFKALHIMAFIDGHLSVINNEKEAPTAYEELMKDKTVKRETVDTLYDLWAEGFAQGKQRLALYEAQKTDS